MSDVLEKSEIDRAKIDMWEMKDKITAIEMELQRENPHKSYLLEKANVILECVTFIKHICEETNES